ncbi:hypothetical protein [Ornithinimicrobium sp. INDO-MA30-4]|uniref:hypothetical protein n=1 Tax=Ornithinimicrobium sp. INDO-MA30-4 TaxID=2908651 RepID=UPI001F3159C7|nr:hypothetical protein [Ornithinimicrobium sp. INDO-MA30-4]UJH69748.1 hypothetical protein L0A91_10630 [Ornithinimicrobium sp. INDO-MA30-4]
MACLRTDALNAGQDFFDGMRVGRQHFCRAPQEVQGVMHFADIDGAHCAEVLRDDEIRVEL